MDLLSVLVGLLIGVVVGAGVVGWVLLRRGVERERQAQDRIRAAEAEAGQSRQELVEARTRAQMLESVQQESSLRHERDANVLKAIGPLGERMQTLQQQVAQLERDRVDQYATLTEQLRTAAGHDRELMQQTSQLLSTLRSTTARGHWGEVQLRRVVEAAGMLAHTDFTEQASLRNAEDARIRPDMLVHVPGGTTIAVDAKAPASDGVAAQHLAEEHDEDARARRDELVRAHAAAVRRHVDDLAKKKYWTGLEQTPELVLCFLPSESLLACALEADPGLLDHAFERGVALVAPVSLLTALKSVAHAWRQESIAQNAQQVVDAARQLYDRLGTLTSHLTKLGASINGSVENYNRLLGTLESRVLPSARRMQSLDATPGEPITAPDGLEKHPRRLSAPELTSRVDDATDGGLGVSRP